MLLCKVCQHCSPQKAGRSVDRIYKQSRAASGLQLPLRRIHLTATSPSLPTLSDFCTFCASDMASGPGIDLNASQASSHVMHGILDGSATPCLKRPLSATHDDDDLNTRKKLKGDMDMDRSNSGKNGEEIPTAVNGDALAEDLAQELMCPCCSDLVYKPVVILPCDHISCGSCLTLWIRVSS